MPTISHFYGITIVSSIAIRNASLKDEVHV